MQLIQVGLNHKTASIEIRERLSFLERELFQALSLLKKEREIKEVVILSTCNRMEIYAVVEEERDGLSKIINFLSLYHQLTEEEFVPYLYIFEHIEVVRHIFEVVASLDSMIVGEPQILGQVRDAYEASLKTKTNGPFLDNLFQKALLVGKRVRSETGIARGAVSVAFAAVELAKKIFGQLQSKTVLIIGTGQMGEDVVKHLLANEATSILTTNRTYEKAVELAQKFNGQAIRFENLHQALIQADIAISSTGAQGLIITKNELHHLMPSRKYRPLFLIDIAVPRDIDPQAAKIDNLYLYNIDDLEMIVTSNLKQRQKEVSKCEFIIEEEVKRFSHWLNFRQVTPLILALKSKIEKIRVEELKRFLSYHKSISKEEKERIESMSERLSSRFLKEPIIAIKRYTHNGIDPTYGQVLSELFGLEAETDEQVDKKCPASTENGQLE